MQLVVQSGAEPGRTYDLAAQKVVIGRQSGNDVVVPDEQVSRKHAEVEERDGRLIVTDLNSSNGTFVNGTRIGSPQVLQAGDTVQVGTTVLKVMASEGGAATLPTSTNYRQAAQDAGYGANASASPSPNNYAAQSGYGSSQPSSAPDYGQAAGGYGQSNPAYDANQYGAQQNNYGQAAGGYGQAGQAYDPNQAQAYNQPMGSGYNQPPGQAYDPNQGYNAQAGYGAQGGYGGQVGTTAAPKKGLPLALIAVGGIVVVLAIILVVVFVVLGGGGGSVGDLPAPKNSSKIDISSQDIVASTTGSNSPVDLTKASSGVYKTSEKPDAIQSFYTDEMKKKGWNVINSAASSTGINTSAVIFSKADLVAEVGAVEIKDQTTLDALEKQSSKLQGKFKVGDTIVVLVQGPKGSGQ